MNIRIISRRADIRSMVYTETRATAYSSEIARFLARDIPVFIQRHDNLPHADAVEILYFPDLIVRYTLYPTRADSVTLRRAWYEYCDLERFHELPIARTTNIVRALTVAMKQSGKWISL